MNKYGEKFYNDNPNYNKLYYDNNKEKWTEYRLQRKGDYIYSLVHMPTKTVFYIGQTHDLYARMQNHYHHKDGKMKYAIEQLGFEDKDIATIYYNFRFDNSYKILKDIEFTEREQKLLLDAMEQYLIDTIVENGLNKKNVLDPNKANIEKNHKLAKSYISYLNKKLGINVIEGLKGNEEKEGSNE